jgi:hypothetical protein
VRTNASAIPFDWGLSTGVVRGSKPISRAKPIAGDHRMADRQWLRIHRTRHQARESDPDLVAIVAAQFEAIRAPTQIGVVDGDAPIMTPFLSTASITLQQKTMGFHDPINAFVVGRLKPLSLGRAPQNSPDPTIAAFSAGVLRRRRSGPFRTSLFKPLLVIDTTLLLPLIEGGERVRSIKGRLHSSQSTIQLYDGY